MKASHAKQVNQTENDSFSTTTTIAALLFLAAKFPQPAIQQRRVMHPFWYGPHRDVAD